MAVTVNDLLAKMAADFGLANLSISASPVSNTQGLRYLNIAQLAVVGNLCPVRLRGGEFSLGRLDKLTRLTEVENKSETAPAGTDPNLMALPSSNTPLHYVKIEVSINAGSYYPATEVSYAYLYAHRAGQTYAATASTPLFCWGDGAIFVVPNGNSTTQAINYHFIEKPTDLTVGGNWGIDEDLTIPSLDLGMAMSWGQVPGEKAVTRIEEHLDKYRATMEFMNPIEILEIQEGS